MSRKGVEFVARHEGFRSEPYADPAGHCTRGYGELIHFGACSGSESSTSEPDARKWLRRRLNRVYLPAVPRRFRMKQCERDALASFAYNLGAGAVSDASFSTLARRLKSSEGRTYSGRCRIYAQELPKWVMAGGRKLPGLVTRRNDEVRLATQGDYK